ncbi:hypothetical protein [Planosporangium mesophilum]|uniref:Uncharacterized protein n=1 Tax=Planosporangium mesophilum TaxID=689768 RepID=A0A8J3T921_9ACTN|nr:hypothetical protein [Planosporangium mesophilum]NJC81070.1 hypothetical protein [Planosporangium mesophilum]GII21286.1 hypothetical protein Pme01_08830 [Planosporangium mesophilum]
MSHHSTSRSPIALPFPPAEWDLLVRLPGRVLIAATAVRPEDARHTVGEGLAGIEAIAAGRASPSRLPHDVVAAIYAERAGDVDPREFADPRSAMVSVLTDCRAAARTLARRVAGSDADAYRDWLVEIATTVCSAGRPHGWVTLAEQRFLADLALALAV